MLGYWVRRLAEGGLVAALTTTSPPRLAHPDGGPKLAGTNPLAIGIPSSDGGPVVADVSMAAVTHGEVIAGLAKPEDVVPFGGEQAHKAFALAVGLQLLVDSLSARATARSCWSRARRPIPCRLCASAQATYACPVTDLAVDVRGDGDTAVLVHGSGVRDWTWSDQLELADRYRLVMPYRRGYGESPDADPDFEVDGRDVAELLDRPSHLVGFSYGGVGSLLATARRPELVRTLTVIEPPAFGVALDDPAVQELGAKLASIFEDRERTRRNSALRSPRPWASSRGRRHRRCARFCGPSCESARPPRPSFRTSGCRTYLCSSCRAGGIPRSTPSATC